MQKEKNISTQEVISMEEYLNKRQKIREQTIRWQIRRREKPCLDDGRALCMRC